MMAREAVVVALQQADVSLGELLAHKGLAMTGRYAHLSISDLHEGVP
jgi:hypothetical protein